MVPLLCLLALSVTAEFESPFIEHVDAEGFSAQIQDPDFFVVGIIYAQGLENVKVFSQLLDSVLPKLHHYSKVIALDCTNDDKVCSKETRQNLPALSGYQPAGLNPYTGKPLVHKRDYEGVMGLKELTDWLANYAAYFGEDLDNQRIENFLKEDLNKVLLFSNKPAAPLMFKGLTSLFRGRLEFGFIGKDQTDLQTRFQVTAFPTVLVIAPQGTITYEGNLDFELIADFLQPFASEEKRLPRLKAVKEQSASTPKEELPVFQLKLLDADTFEPYLEASQKLVLVHYYKTEDIGGWPDIKAKYNGIADLAELDCTNSKSWELAKTHGVKRLPSLRLFPMNRKRKSQELAFDEFFEETLSKELKYTIQPLDNKNIGSYIQSMRDLQKVGFLLLDTELSLQFKAIASEPAFKESLGFGFYSTKDEAILASFNLKRYPTILSFITVGDDGQMQTAEYTGPLDDYKFMHLFAEQLQGTYKKPTHGGNEWKEEEVPLYDSFNFNRLCVKKGGVCLIAFLEGDLVNPTQTSERNQRHFETLQKLQAEASSQKSPVRFGWADGVCQYETREAFNIPETALPNVVLYFPGKKL